MARMMVRARARSSLRSPAPPGSTWADASWWRALATVAVIAVVATAFFLSLYVFAEVRGPIGWDSSQYVWRTALAQERGLDGLPATLDSGIPVKPGRPAFPALAAPLASLQGASLLDLSAALPIALSATVALAAGVLAARAVRARSLELGVLAVAVAVSPNLVLMLQYGYNDQLVVLAAFVAAVAAASVSAGRGPLILAVALHGAAGLAHAPFLLLTAPILLGAALLALPRSRRARSPGEPFVATPSGRLGLVALAGPAVAATLAVTLGTGFPSPGLEREVFSEKLSADLPRYALFVSLPLAAVGAWIAVRAARADTRQGVVAWSLVAWVATIPAALIAYLVLPLPMPVNRVLVFTVALPVLVSVVVVAAGRVAGRARRLTGWGLLAAGLAGLGVVGLVQLADTAQQTSPRRLDEAAWADTYLRDHRVPAERPIVFIVDDRSAQPALRVALMMDHLLAVLPPARYDHTYAFLGSPNDFLAGRASRRAGRASYEPTSMRLLERLPPSVRGDAVALLLPAYNTAHWESWTEGHPETVAGVGAVVRGPVGEPVPASASVSGSVPRLAITTLVSIAILMVIGLGWARAGIGDAMGRLHLAAVAPAVGAAMLVLGAVLADRLGARLNGWTAAAVAVVVASLGWGAAAVRPRMR